MPRKPELSGTLRRGSACLSCRKRKLRCDGVRPLCQPCSSSKRSHDCVYDDSYRKSRTQRLREKEFALREKLLKLEENHSSDVTANLPLAAINLKILQEDPSHLHYSNPLYAGDNLWLDVQAGYSQVWDCYSDGQVIDVSVSSRTATPPFANALVAFTDSSGASSSSPDRFFNETGLAMTPEMHNILMQSFIMHSKQCCFYSSTTRFDSSSPATIYQSTPPHFALTSAIYLMGCFFAHIPDLEQQLLEQTLHETSRALHNQEQLIDLVQALGLLSQYFFFKDKPMEGICHFKTVKQIVIDLGLHQIAPTSFDFAYQNWKEQALVLWQLFIVEHFWSANNDYCKTLPVKPSPCPTITTPLPVLEDAQMEAITRNSTIYSLFYSDDFQGSSLSVTAFKVMAASIFDHSLRVHYTSNVAKDNTSWAYYRATRIALERLCKVVLPFRGRESNFNNHSIDSDLYSVHSLILASTILLHLDKNMMDTKLQKAARNMVELIHQLNDDDYPFMDPILSVCWAFAIKIFRRMIEVNKRNRFSYGELGPTFSYTDTFLRQCITSIFTALRNISVYFPLAERLMEMETLNHTLPDNLPSLETLGLRIS